MLAMVPRSERSLIAVQPRAVSMRGAMKPTRCRLFHNATPTKASRYVSHCQRLLRKSLSRTDWVSKCNFCRMASREMRGKVRIFRWFPLDSVGACRYLPTTGPQSRWAVIWGREPRMFAKRRGSAAVCRGGMSYRDTSSGFAGGFGSAMRTGARFLWFAS